MTVKARDPRNSFPNIEKTPLAIRRPDLDGQRIVLVQCMPPYDLSDSMKSVGRALVERFPNCDVSTHIRQNFMTDDSGERERLISEADAIVLFVGPSATSTFVHWAYGIQLEQSGIPVSLVIPSPLKQGVEYEMRMRGCALRHVLAPVLAGETAALQKVSGVAVDHLVRRRTPEECESGVVSPLRAERYIFEGSPDDVQHTFLREGLTDGLPIVIPTDDKVEEMLSGTSRNRDEVVCETLRPEGLSTNVEKVAINAVMAGARPEQLPVILASISLYGSLQLESMTRSLNGFAFTHLINGPIGRDLEIESRCNALGRGNPVNMVISRSIGLVLKNCGHQHFGINSDPVMGNPLGLPVFAENETGSPFEPLHTSMDYKAADNVVSLYVGGHAFLGNYNYEGLPEAAEHMRTFANKQGVLLLLSEKRAQEWAEQGMTRDRIVDELHRLTSSPLGKIRASGFFGLMKTLIERGGEKPPWPKDYLTRPDDDVVPEFATQGIHVAVVGSALASIMQAWSASYLASACIDEWM